MKLTKTSDQIAQNSTSQPAKQAGSSRAMSRRGFLRNSGLMAGGAALATTLSPTMMKKAKASTGAGSDSKASEVKTICTHCSVGCGIIAEVKNGVWTGQEPAFDHPFNLGAHCAKGAAVREHGHGERRLKYPTKLVNGKWTKISWEQAINEVGDRLLQTREQSGPDSVYWLGSAKHNNEQAYLFRKFAALWGTNNVDHQARICHSTTVAGRTPNRRLSPATRLWLPPGRQVVWPDGSFLNFLRAKKRRLCSSRSRPKERHQKDGLHT